MFGTLSSADDAGKLLARPSVKCVCGYVNYYAVLVLLFASTPHDRLIIEYRLHTHIMKSFPSLNQRILHSVAHTLSVCRFMLQLDRIYFANVFLYVAYVRAHCKPCSAVAYLPCCAFEHFVIQACPSVRWCACACHVNVNARSCAQAHIYWPERCFIPSSQPFRKREPAYSAVGAVLVKSFKLYLQSKTFLTSSAAQRNAAHTGTRRLACASLHHRRSTVFPKINVCVCVYTEPSYNTIVHMGAV